MKIISVIIALVFSNLCANGQLYFGINAGVNMGNIITKVDGKKDSEIKSAPGYIVSGDVNIPVSSNLLFVTGLQFESIHNKVDTESFNDFGGGFTIREKFKGRASVNYINIPAKIFYKLPVSKNNLVIGAGPFVGIGVGGKSKSTETITTTSGGNTNPNVNDYKSKTKFGNENGEIKRINFGVGANLGFLLANNIQFSLYSNIGLANLNNRDKHRSKTIAYGLTIGYIFARKS